MAGPSPPPTGDLIITIDGPAGTGKSTVAHRLAQRLGLAFLDTGAMYRAAALLSIESGIDPADGEALAGTLARADLGFDWSTDPPRLWLDDRDVSDRIRDLDVSGVVSTVAAHKAVRAVLVEQQRRIARVQPRLVTEGRDQGSVVFPDAPFRFFLDADVAVRARRRVAQLAEAGKSVDEARILNDIAERDRIDSSRAEGPLVPPEGAITVDTGRRTIDEVVGVLESIVRATASPAEPGG